LRLLDTSAPTRSRILLCWANCFASFLWASSEIITVTGGAPCSLTSYPSNRPRLNEAFRIGPCVTQRLRTVRSLREESTLSPTLASRYLNPVLKVRSKVARLRPSSERGYHATEDLIRKKST
jgi:hypothetical protein